jgi:hypothetical protein
MPLIFTSPIFWGISILILILLTFLILKIILKKLFVNNSYFDHQVFLVKLPKEKPGENDNDKSVNALREEIAKGEAVIASLGGLKSQRGYKAWLMGRNDHFSFEIVSHKNRIAFYIVSPKNLARYVEQQVHAHYPEASVEAVEDYNIFQTKVPAVAASIKTQKKYLFPLKTYQKLDVDALNSIINVMSKLKGEESLAIQYVVRSSHPSWHAKVKSVVRKIQKTNSISDGLSAGNFFNELFSLFSAPKKDEGMQNNKRLSAVEEEMLKAIEEKNSKAGLDVNIRIIASTKTREQSKVYINNIANAFTECNNFSYGNIFTRSLFAKQKTLLRNFIFRRFNDKTSFLLNTEELATIFHFPLKHTETPNIVWLSAKTAPASNDIPTEGILLGTNTFRGEKKEIRIKRPDRRRHTYIVGKSGVGKSVLLSSMAIQDILNGEGICVIDPHGDLVDDILKRIPASRAEDVIIFSPGDTQRPMALNLLEYDARYPEQKSFVINEMIGIFDKLYDLKSTGGPMFEQYMRNALLLIMDSPETGSTLMEVPKVLADEEFRAMKLSLCKNKTVVDFWRNEAEKAGGEAALANIVPYITSKLTSFISNDMMRPIIGQQNSSFNFRDIMDKQKILMISLPKGVVGEMNAYLLGMIVVGKILMASLSRADMKGEDRKDFYLYIDEFQNFTTDSICQILSEARKYALNLIIAHQYIGQLTKNNSTEIKDAVFGNVGTMISFKIGSEDAEFLVKEFSPVFNEFDLLNVEKYTAYVKLLVDNAATRPFSMATTWPLPGVESEELADKIRSLSRLKYGKEKALVEAEIAKRTNIKKTDA